MAATSAIQDINNNNEVVNRHEIQAAVAKAVELRALHAALMQGSSPTNLKFSSASPGSLYASHFSAQDYPVFTPSYEEEPLPGYQQLRLDSRSYADSWDEYGLGGDEDESNLSNYTKANASSMKGFPNDLLNLETHVCPADDQRSVTGSSTTNNNALLRTSPGTDFCKSRRNSLGEFRSVSSSCNKCRPAVINTETDLSAKSLKNSNLVVPLTESHSSVNSQPKNRVLNLSRLFPRLKKKNKNGNSPNRTEPEEVSQIFKDLGMVSVETLRKELLEANERRDTALSEVAEMKSSMGDLRQKLEHLETYCEELKKALRQAAQTKSSQVIDKLGNFSKQGKSIAGNGENLMPVSEEAMVEGFLQMVSEARLSVKQFCKILLGQIDEADNNLRENLNFLLLPYKLSLNSKFSKAILYHVEAIINQSLYQDFENCVFQKNGSPKLLDPQQERHSQFSSFVALRNLSWNEVLRKGTKYYSEDFSKFCDQKMSLIITTLNWKRPWPEQLLQAFFVTAKCIWLLHLLAFSFNPPVGILRVEENRTFDPHYMEDIFMDRQKTQGPSRVKIVVMPGFYVHDKVLRCKVLCRYKSVVK
ncbi:IRK-interacting protein [Coffea eugenioides]|uniref:IRK-interacting protein n=1 Tax=Coffea eugenioides TaxID=49369 RepID=UPI000F61520E|nr:IRK-interacting protein [Coffea eugenioides]